MSAGRGRSISAKEDLRAGSLLFVSEPVGSALTGQVGQDLQPKDLQAHWTAGNQKLTAADRYTKLQHCAKVSWVTTIQPSQPQPS